MNETQLILASAPWPTDDYGVDLKINDAVDIWQFLAVESDNDIESLLDAIDNLFPVDDLLYRTLGADVAVVPGNGRKVLCAGGTVEVAPEGDEGRAFNAFVDLTILVEAGVIDGWQESV